MLSEPSQSGKTCRLFLKRHINLTQLHLCPLAYELSHPLGAPRPLARALLTVALPLAKPTPLPFTPLLLNIGAFLFRHKY